MGSLRITIQQEKRLNRAGRRLGLAKTAAMIPSVARMLAVLLALVPIAAQRAPAQTEKVLYSFAGGTDGVSPFAGLVRGLKGNFYGTTWGGGANGAGVVYEITPSGKETVLYSFAGGNDGAAPWGTLIRDRNGNLYGTASRGGTYNCGTVFEVTPSGAETVLYTFTCYYNGWPDGGSPYGGLIFARGGNLYGTTTLGGEYGAGTVFELTPSGTETVLHSFGGGTDGSQPYARLAVGMKGNLYGTTYGGGVFGYGTVFQVTRSGTVTVFHSFSGSDGAYPYDGLIRDEEGNLYGTTCGGGAYGYGALFKLTPTGTETVLYSFAGSPDGANPWGSLALDKEGNLYGTTSVGGAYGYGAVFELTPSGAETVLHSFTGSDGYRPYAGLLLGGEGKLFGTTLSGGAYTWGTVFEVIP